jgi:hypothetical protein
MPSSAVTVTANFEAIPVTVSPVPVFDGLLSVYQKGVSPVPLAVTGTGSAAFTVFKVNGVTAAEFNPAETGRYLIEALSDDGKLRIWRYVRVVE